MEICLNRMRRIFNRLKKRIHFFYNLFKDCGDLNLVDEFKEGSFVCFTVFKKLHPRNKLQLNKILENSFVCLDMEMIKKTTGF